jgi:hypothetical protein
VKQRAPQDPNLHYLDGRDLYGEADFCGSRGILGGLPSASERRLAVFGGR